MTRIARPISTAIAALLATHILPARAAPPAVSGGVYQTTASVSDVAQLCSGGTYPAPFTWIRPGSTARHSPAVAPASSGTPRIEQYRAGQLIATYTSFANQPGCTYLGGGQDVQTPGPAAASGCGPFTRKFAYRLALPGDEFRVYPAVYSGDANQPWFGPMWDSYAEFLAGISHTPDGVHIRGMIRNGRKPVIRLDGPASDNTLSQAPVYFDHSSGILFEGVDVIATPRASVGRAGIFVGAASDLTLRGLRVSGFGRSGANGVFSTGEGGGTLWLDQMELDHNGGAQGYAHNAYIGGSAIDENFTLKVTGLWSHDVHLGHLLKSRAQNTIVLGSYFQGRNRPPAARSAESYLIDIPQGGQFSLRNSVLVKAASGPLSNATMISYGAEGLTAGWQHGFDIENNDFVAFSATIDGSAPIIPMGFLSPRIRPDSVAWPAGVAHRVLKNAYIGLCGAPYWGDAALRAGFADLASGFVLTTKVNSDDAALAAALGDYVSALGLATYAHVAGVGAARTLPTLGAMD